MGFRWLNNLYERAKKRLNRKPSSAVIRGSDDLFQSGNIFEATKEELEHCIKETSTRSVPNPTVQHREIVRALVVNNIQNQRRFDSVESRNAVLTIIIIILTIINLALTVRLIDYAEIQSRSDRIFQEQAIKNALNFCKASPQSQQSGLYEISNGNPAPCSEVLQQYK